MSDTAEYWWDIKSRRSPKRVFVHLKEHNCGHFHLFEAKKIKDVDCYDCLKHIEQTPNLKARLDQSKKSQKI